MRIKLVVQYDGTDFSGWASQEGHRTVRGTLTEAVRLVSNDEAVEIWGSSRTDSGAHAKGQVCHFDTDHGIPPEKWAEILSRRLPRDLVISRSREMPERFHARHCAISRHYRYRLLVGERDPQRARYVHRHYAPVDVGAMRRAARLLVGTHDFRAFTEELEPHVLNTVRTLFDVKVSPVRDEVWVDIVGTAFLRGMMRRISGGLLEVGRGRRDVVEVSRLLDPGERENIVAPVVLPASGLCLMKIRFDRRLRDVRTLPKPSFQPAPGSAPVFDPSPDPSYETET